MSTHRQQVKNLIKPFRTCAPPVLLQRKCTCGNHTMSGECEECKSNKGFLQRASLSPRGRGIEGEGEVPPIVHEVLRSPGQPLDPATRAFMEPRFGHDFSGVRVHTDAKAAESAQAVNALAYTVGRHVVFGDGQYRPNSIDGARVLAHELTHTLQQRGDVLPASLQISAPGERSEREAEGIAQAVLQGRTIEPQAGQSSLLQRQPTAGDVDLAESASPFLASAIGSVTIDGFETGQAELSPGNRAKLAETARNMVKLFKRYSLSTVRVIGHADAIGKEIDNQKLGQDRADAVRDALTEVGVPADSIVTESKGETALLVKTEKAEPRNRRAEVHFEPKASPVGGLIPGLPSPTIEPPKIEVDFCKRNPDLCIKPKPEPGPGGPSLPPDFFKPLPPAPKRTQKSALDVLNEKIVDPIVNGVTRGLGLSKDIQKKALELAHDGVEKGITSGLKSALGAAGVDPKGQEAIEKAVEAAIKEKGQR